MNLLEYTFLVLVALLSQMPITFSQDQPMTLAEIKTKDVEQLRDLRQRALQREADLRIINGKGKTPDNRTLLDPFVGLNDSDGHPSVVWLTSYGGDPVGWEVVFFALMPIALAKVIRTSRNVFRPTLHLRQGITDFPLVPLIYLQQTKLEQRVKREKRNGIDWLGKKFLIRASDNFVDIKEVKHQPTQKVVPKNPWALLRFLTKFNVVYQHAHTKHEHDHDHEHGHSHPSEPGEVPEKPRIDLSLIDLSDDPTPKRNPLLARVLALNREGRAEPNEIENRRDTKVTFSRDPKSQEVREEEYDEEESDEEEEKPPTSDPKHPHKEQNRQDPSKDKNDIHRKTSFEVISEKQKPEGQGQGQRKQSVVKEPRPKPPAWGTKSIPAEGAAAAAPIEPELPYHLRQLKDFIAPKETKKQERRGSDRDPEADHK